MTGIFDSGIGGLFILQELKMQIPYLPVIYLADTKYFPYGKKSALQIQALVNKNINYLTAQGVHYIVIACNTACTGMKNLHYNIPVWGVVEFALQQARYLSKNRQVIVLATKATAQSGIYKQKNEELKTKLHIYQQACPGLASFVEDGEWIKQPDKLFSFLDKYLKPFLNRGVDTVILGCTHYLYLRKEIQKYIGPYRKIADPVHFLINHLKINKVLKTSKVLQESIPLFVSGDVEDFSKKVSSIFGELKFHAQKMETIDLI